MQAEGNHANNGNSARVHSIRPKYINLFTLSKGMSITAKISILHRISGFILALSIPFILYLMSMIGSDVHVYEFAQSFFSSQTGKLFMLFLVWCLAHHLFAGVRFLFLDIHKGVELKQAKLTARVVLALGLVSTLLIGVFIIW